jgi:hypothetical protein
MPMMRGTRVVLLLDAVGAKAGDVGKVSSRKKNGWLRVTCCWMGDIRKTVSVRNTKSNVIRYDEWLKQHTIKLTVKPEEVWYDKPMVLRSLSPLQRLEDAAIERTEQGLDTFVDSEDDMMEPIIPYRIKEDPAMSDPLKEQILIQQMALTEQLKRINELEETVTQQTKFLKRAKSIITEYQKRGHEKHNVDEFIIVN